MTCRILLLTILSIFSTSLALAAPRSSEFLFQPSAGTQYLSLNYFGASPNVKDHTDDKLDIKSSEVSATYEYGLSDAIAFYGGLTYLNVSTEGDFKGLGPLRLGAKYSRDLGPGMFFTKLHVAAQILDGKIDCDMSPCNASDGSIGTSLQVAYQWALQQAYWGLSLKQGLFSTDAKIKNGFSYDKVPATTLSFFYERTFAERHLYGFDLSYRINDGIMGSANSFFISGDQFTIEEFEVDAVTLRAYFNAAVMENLTLLGSLEFAKITSDDLVSDKSTSLAYGLSARMTF